MWRRLIYHPDINYALRQTLVLCLPVAVGLMLGELRFGLLFSLVPACCNIAGLDTPHKRFFKRLIIGASLFATCSLLTQLLLAKDVPLPFLLTGLTLVLGVTAELGPLHAKLLPASLLAAIFTLSLAGYMPVWEPLLIYALGTLWYGLFNWFWFWIWREQPLRESLSLLYRELADYCEAKYSLLTQHTDPEKAGYRAGRGCHWRGHEGIGRAAACPDGRDHQGYRHERPPFAGEGALDHHRGG